MYYDPKLIGLTTVRQSGDEALCLCPYHDDRHPSASFNVRKGLFFCYTCGASKNAQQLAKDLGGEVVDLTMSDPTVALPRLEDEYEAWSKFLGFPWALNNDYLRSRQVTNYQVINHRIMDYNGRGVIFPMMNLKEDVGVVVRQLEREPRYLILGKRPPVWPMDLIPQMTEADRIFVVEGVFGVLRLEKFGQTAIATLGTGGVNRALRFINSNPGIFEGRTVGLMDADLPGKVAAAKFIMNGIPVVHMNRKDPDEWTQDTWDGLKSRFDELTCDSVYELVKTIKRGDRDKFFEAMNRLEGE